MNKCPVCGGTMNEGAITHPQEYEGRIILLENVPVLACGQLVRGSYDKAGGT